MHLEPIQQVAALIAASAIALSMAIHLTLAASGRSRGGSWPIIARESGRGVLTGGFVALASLAAARGLSYWGDFSSLAPSHRLDPLSLVCVVATLLLFCGERGSWKGHQPATLLAALVPWILVPELGDAEGMRLPVELLGLASAALYRVAFSGAHSSRLSSEARHAAVEATGDGVLVVDLQGRLIEANDTGREAFAALTSPQSRANPENSSDGHPLPDRVLSLLSSPEARHFSLRNSTDSVYEIWLGSTDSSLHAGSNRALIIRDVSDQRRDEKHLNRIAHYDSLTGLANRRLFINHLDSALGEAKRAGTVVALLYIDLDRFKEINDTLGHGAGDELLRVIALRFQKLAQADYPARLRGPTPASVCRLGGDEFAVVISDPADLHEVEEFSQRLLQEIRDPLTLAGREVASSGSIGIATYPQDGEDVETLVKHADSALYGAKRLGRNRYQRYQPEFSREADRTRVIEQELRGAIERHELQLHYQPKVDVATGTVAGFEALMRWKSRELGHVSPNEFIPIAEERGLITTIGAWCIDEACQQILRWQNAGFDPPPIAVNVSSAQFIGSNLQELVKKALADSGVPAALLEIELTERLLLKDDEETSRCLQDIQAMGISLALDDFGTGYSALTYLNRFPLNVVKMDRGLIMDIETSDSAAGIAAAVISMCHSLGLKVVAEGVDAEGQLRMLREMSCDLIQGFLYSPALEANDVTPLLAAFGQDRPTLEPKPDEIAFTHAADPTPECELEGKIESSEWKTAPIDPAPERDSIQHALFLDGGGGLNQSVAARLAHLGVTVHEFPAGVIGEKFVAPREGKINLVVLGSDVDLTSARRVLKSLESQNKSKRASIVVTGKMPSDDRRKALRELGAEWALWTPFDDVDLRFVVRSAMPTDYASRERNAARIPTNAMAWIRARARREVGVLSSLSRRGAFVEMAEPLPEGSSIKLEFELPAGRISTFAKVVHQRMPSGVNPDISTSGIDVTFYGLDPAGEFTIGEIVDANAERFKP